MNAPISNIRKCFDAELLNFCGANGLDEKKLVAWPNMGFKPDVNKVYLRPSLLLSEPGNASLGTDGFTAFSGIYQISIFERIDVGLAGAEQLASKLINHFKAGRVLDCGGIEATITMSAQNTAIPEEKRLQIPISIYWTCYSQRQ